MQKKPAYDIMTKFKEHYDKSKSNDVDHYIRKTKFFKIQKKKKKKKKILKKKKKKKKKKIY